MLNINALPSDTTSFTAVRPVAAALIVRDVIRMQDRSRWLRVKPAGVCLVVGRHARLGLSQEWNPKQQKTQLCHAHAFDPGQVGEMLPVDSRFACRERTSCKSTCKCAHLFLGFVYKVG